VHTVEGWILSFSGKKILVTGAGGFIGSHLVEALASLDADVTAMLHYNANSSIGNLAFLPATLRDKLKIIFGNIEDSDYVARAIEGQQIVFHLAALIAIPYSYIAPRSYIRTNIEGTLNVLEAARRLGTPRIIHTSTSEVYGTALKTPIDEHHPLQGQSPYAASKIGADKLAESYYRSFDLPVVTIRPFNTFGPRQSARAIIPTIISQAFETSGSIRLGSLSPERDMTFVSDTVAGFLAAASTAGIEGETINLGTGEARSIGQFAQSILTSMGCDSEIELDKRRLRPQKSEVGVLISDNRKAARLLGWAPTVSVDQGLRETIKFIGEHRHLYRPEAYSV
jgi:NAD dependent epimerase/dehydratase